VEIKLPQKIMRQLLPISCENKKYHCQNYFSSKGRTPNKMTCGDTPDISELAIFECYQAVWYLNPTTYPNQNKLICRWIGISHRTGQAIMCFWILSQNDQVLSWSPVQAISDDELKKDTVKNMLTRCGLLIDHHIGDNNVSVYPCQHVWLSIKCWCDTTWWGHT
jgi:hypothetical protein